MHGMWEYEEYHRNRIYPGIHCNRLLETRRFHSRVKKNLYENVGMTF